MVYLFTLYSENDYGLSQVTWIVHVYSVLFCAFNLDHDYDLNLDSFVCILYYPCNVIACLFTKDSGFFCSLFILPLHLPLFV